MGLALYSPSLSYRFMFSRAWFNIIGEVNIPLPSYWNCSSRGVFSKHLQFIFIFSLVLIYGFVTSHKTRLTIKRTDE